MKKPSLYLVSILLFMLILPIASIVAEYLTQGTPLGWALIGRWFVFWCIGIRLFIAGVRQVTKPAFTAKEIFHFTGTESFPVIRELGFGNISIGVIGILSLHSPAWCHPAAICGGLYYGLAGIGHVLKPRDSFNETLAMVSDLLLCALIVVYLICTYGIR